VFPLGCGVPVGGCWPSLGINVSQYLVLIAVSIQVGAGPINRRPMLSPPYILPTLTKLDEKYIFMLGQAGAFKYWQNISDF